MTESRRARRRWVAKLAEPIPEGPNGQPAHPAGSEITLVTPVQVPGVGPVSVAVPRMSTLIHDAAERHLKKAVRLRAATMAQTRPIRSAPQSGDRVFSNEDLTHDFFGEAAAGVILAAAALDNLANELMPWDFVFQDEGSGQARTRVDLERSAGLELRLSRVASAATNRANLRTHDPALWSRLMAIKELRDDVAHAKADQAYALDDGSLLGRLFAADLADFGAAIQEASEHYVGNEMPG